MPLTLIWRTRIVHLSHGHDRRIEFAKVIDEQRMESKVKGVVEKEGNRNYEPCPHPFVALWIMNYNVVTNYDSRKRDLLCAQGFTNSNKG